MKIYLDLSVSKVAKVQLKDGDAIKDEVIGKSALVLIDTLLKKHHLKLTDLEEVDSFKGPGSFTGLKVGATIANTINYALGNNKTIEPVYEVVNENKEK